VGRYTNPVSPPVKYVRCGDDTLAGWRGGWRSIFWKTPDTALHSTYVNTLWSLLRAAPTWTTRCRRLREADCSDSCRRSTASPSRSQPSTDTRSSSTSVADPGLPKLDFVSKYRVCRLWLYNLYLDLCNIFVCVKLYLDR
jgi:hypothetical protein